jgi:hypothetical protein
MSGAILICTIEKGMYGRSRVCEAIADARKSHNDELHNSCSPHILKVIKWWEGGRWTEHVLRMRELRGEYKMLV